MFNLLPRHLRNFRSDQVENFKLLLDKYLERIPDIPQPGRVGSARLAPAFRLVVGCAVWHFFDNLLKLQKELKTLEQYEHPGLEGANIFICRQ